MLYFNLQKQNKFVIIEGKYVFEFVWNGKGQREFIKIYIIVFKGMLMFN